MTARRQLRRTRSSFGRWRALLLLGLLAGLLGMHALGPADAGAAGSRSPHHSPAVTTHAGMGTADEFICHGADGSGGHAQHADATCASGAVGAGPVLPPLMPDPVDPAPSADDLPGAFTATPWGGRAPPTLAELQLLRI
ncbi:DUF6153 family protein [Streptomyces sp. NPDC060077]|uniref:DUF6153 family protein n=1 Tax=Streptomyces sp. NPDC060077 TaxID=3347052 RepID=UPI003646CB03